ncbi:MAG TPA: hypothetical protein VH114_09000 [Candidatus Acidoferrum sp.]|nr:hypothetical protein [Candidatus Acidoferrum sp.]
MTAQTKRRALIAACGLLAIVLASRIFYFQELFFAFLLFAAGYLILVLLAALAACLWLLWARGVVYLASRATKQGNRALPMLRVLVLWLAPTVARTAEAVSAGQQILFYPLLGLTHSWLQSFRRDALHLRDEAGRAAKHLRLRLKQS